MCRQKQKYSRSLRCGTESVRRFRRTAQVAFHCLRNLLHVPVAVPTLGYVKRRTVLPLLQLCCVELVCKQFTVAATRNKTAEA